MNWIRWKSPADGLGERLDRHRLGEPRDALDEQVTAGQQRDEHPLQQPVLADDRLLDLVQGLLEGGRFGVGPWISRLGRCRLVGHCCGPPAAPPAVAIGTANPIPTKKSCLAGLASAVTMPTTCPARLSSGPPLLPGLTAASNWMRPVSVCRRPVGDGAVGGRHHARGEAVREAERVADREDRRRRPAAGRPSPRAPRRREPVRPARRCRRPAGSRSPSPPAVVPSANATWIRVAPSTTCRAVSTAPAALMTTPLPSRVSMRPPPPPDRPAAR